MTAQGPAIAVERVAVQRRTLRVLICAQALGGLAIGVGASVSPLLAKEILDRDGTFAGVGPAPRAISHAGSGTWMRSRLRIASSSAMASPTRSGTPNTELPVTNVRVTIEEIGGGKTRMTIVTEFPTVEAMEKLAMGVEEGRTQAVGQIDAILAEDGEGTA